MCAELSSTEARKVLSDGALQILVEELQRPARAATALDTLRKRAKTALPYRVVKVLRRSPQWHLSAKRLAFRAYIAARMAAILEEDARVGRTSF